MRSRLHVVFHDEQILAAGSDNTVDMVAVFLLGPGNRMQIGNSGTATDSDNCADFFEMGLFAQGTDDILVAVTHL